MYPVESIGIPITLFGVYCLAILILTALLTEADGQQAALCMCGIILSMVMDMVRVVFIKGGFIATRGHATPITTQFTIIIMVILRILRPHLSQKTISRTITPIIITEPSPLQQKTFLARRKPTHRELTPSTQRLFHSLTLPATISILNSATGRVTLR